tara:strand:+ start:234 stop:611 length:378 start_codon:yes stop_codon:yes gene_type:complete
MELAKLLIKIIYLTVIYGIVYTIMKSNTNLVSYNLIVLSFLVAVLVIYFTFSFVYKMLVNSEIIFKTNKSDKEEDENDEKETNNTSQKGSSKKEKSTEIKVNKENKNNYMLDHTHKFIEEKIFAN